MSWLYVPGLEGSNLASEWLFQGLALSVTWKGKRMQRQFWFREWEKGTWMRHLSGVMHTPSTRHRGVARWILSLLGTRASRSQQQAPERALMTSGGSGRAYGKSFAKWAPAACLWKTSQLTFLGRSDEYSETWPRAGGLRNGTAFQRQPVAPRISAIVSSCSLPTPTAQRYGSQQGGALPGPQRYSLDTMATRGVLPTPTASDSKRGPLTPKTIDHRLKPKNGWVLAEYVLMLPTPTATDSNRGTGSGPKTKQRRETSTNGLNLTETMLAHTGTSHRLNPRFVEWMMGLPVGWTECGCTVSETP